MNDPIRLKVPVTIRAPDGRSEAATLAWKDPERPSEGVVLKPESRPTSVTPRVEVDWGLKAYELDVQPGPLPEDEERRAEAGRILGAWSEACDRARATEDYLARSRQQEKERQEAAEARALERLRAHQQRRCGFSGPPGSPAHERGVACELEAGHDGYHQGTTPGSFPEGGRRAIWDDDGKRVNLNPDVGAYEPATSPQQCRAASPEGENVRCTLRKGHDGAHIATISQEGYRQVSWAGDGEQPERVTRHH